MFARLSRTSCLVAGLGALLLVGVPSGTSAVLEQGVEAVRHDAPPLLTHAPQAPPQVAPVLRVAPDGARPAAHAPQRPGTPGVIVGPVGGVTETQGGLGCHYENLRLGEPFFWAAQKATDFPFYAEAADDFILFDPDDPNGANGCVLDKVTFAVFHTVPGVSPAFWDGVKITIYQEKSQVCLDQPLDFPCIRNPDKGPGGYPVPFPDVDREHLPCCPMPSKPAIVCELKIPMDKVVWKPLPQFPDSYEITVFDLKQFDCKLEKNKKYWCAPAPEMRFSEFGQTFLFGSPNLIDHEAQQIFEAAGIPFWSTASQLGYPDRDLYLAIWANKQQPDVQACHYENLRLGAACPASQKAVDVPFYAEAADDFILIDPDDPDGDNNCRLDRVVFAVFHGVPGVSPADWEGVKITIYQDRGVVCDGQPLDFPCDRIPDKGPGGYPLDLDDPDDRDHAACCPDPDKAAIVCELKISMDKVSWVPLVGGLPDSYEITVSELKQFSCHLEKNKKYWLAPAPVMANIAPDGTPLGQTFLYASPNQIGHEAQQVFLGLGLPWSGIMSQVGCPDPDLYLAIWANKSPPCPWDCGDDDRNVGIVDFLALLSQWGIVGAPCDFDGGGVGITDFLKLLANWGPCP